MQCQGKSFYDFLDDGSVRHSAASLRHLACEQRAERESQAAQQAAENAAEDQKQARDGPKSEVHEQQSAEQQQAQHAQQQQQQKVKEPVAQGCSAYSKVFPAGPMAQSLDKPPLRASLPVPCPIDLSFCEGHATTAFICASVLHNLCNICFVCGPSEKSPHMLALVDVSDNSLLLTC